MRFFTGSETRQINLDGSHADPALWYYEPSDYDGDVLWSVGYPTREAAEKAADLEPVDY